MNSKLPPRSASAAALLAVVLTTLAALLAAVRWRLPAAELDFAWPWPSSQPPLDPVLAVTTAAAGLAATLAWFGHRERAWRRSLIESLIWPAAPLAAVWLIMPASGSPGSGTLLAVATAGLAAWWLHRRAGRSSSVLAGQTRARIRGRWIGLHVAAIGALVVLGVRGGGFADPAAFALSVVLYPVYALCQLFLVLAVTWPRLAHLSAGRHAGPVTVLAVIFALVHWPNPVLMMLTGGGMVFWAAAYARGRGLAVLALSMGLLASLAGQGLPDAWTDHMRAGPRCVRERAVPRIAAGAAARAGDRVAGEERTTAFLADLYPRIVGRAAAPEELRRWWRSIAACRRGVLAWRFFISDEYRRRLGGPAGESPLPGDVHWTHLPAPWPERIGAYTRQPADSATTWDGFLARLYREILGREASAAERAGWDRGLSPRQQQRLVRVLLDHRRDLAAAPLDTCTCERMLLHH